MGVVWRNYDVLCGDSWEGYEGPIDDYRAL